MKHLVYIFLLAIILFSCAGRSRFAHTLDAMDSLMKVNPDSAYKELVAMKDDADNQREALRMRYQLTLADAQNKAYVDFTTDSVMKEVTEYYDNHGTANEKMRAYYLLGCTYRDLHDAPMALQHFQMAVEKADTMQEDCDYQTLISIYGQLANIYYEQRLPQAELSALAMCEKHAIKIRQTTIAINAYELRLRAFYNMNMYDSVLSISENARKRYLAIGNKQKAALLLNPAISILLDRGEYEKAKIYLDIFKKESRCFTNDEITNPSAYLHYRSIGRYALYKNQIDSAKYYFYKLIELNEPEAAYHGLLSIYEKTGQADSVMKYSRLYAIANDSSHRSLNAEIVAQMSTMYDYAREKRNAEIAKTLLLVEKGKSSIYLCGVFFLIIVIVVLNYLNIKRRRKTIEEIKALNQDIEHSSLLLNEARRNNNEEELQALKTTLESVHKELQRYKKSDALAAFFDSDTYKLFQKIGLNGKNKITNEEWHTMNRLFQSTFSSYTDFIHLGKSMTNDQLKVCMLIRMGFGEAEMANILGVDHKRISRIKLQINQKLFNMSNAKDLVSNLKTAF